MSTEKNSNQTFGALRYLLLDKQLSDQIWIVFLLVNFYAVSLFFLLLIFTAVQPIVAKRWNDDGMNSEALGTNRRWNYAPCMNKDVT